MALTTEMRSTEPIVEVRTPTFRRPALLKRALDSLVAQTYPHWRCIVLDDEPGGGDGRSVCEALSDTRIIYRPNKSNLGVGRNIDQAFAMTPLPGSTHACVLEDDNYYLPRLMQSNLSELENHHTDIVLRNQYIERPRGRDLNGSVGPSTTYDGQYGNGVLTRKQLWASFFYSTGANNSSLFWRLNRGLSFTTSAFTDDPVFQERLRTLCIDREICVAFEPFIVWRDNGADSFRPKTGGYTSFVLSQAKAAARERRLYQQLFRYLDDHNCLELVFDPPHRAYDKGCERVFARCGIPTPTSGLLTLRDRVRIRILRFVATCVAAPMAEPVKYRFAAERIQYAGSLGRPTE